MKSKICVGLAVFTTALMFPASAWAAVTFAPAVNYPIAGTGPSHVVVGDLNADGKPDLVTANNASANLSVLLGNGDGTFAAPVNVSVGNAPSTVAIDDLNADGKPDLAAANTTDASISVLLGNGDGTFAAAPTVTTGDSVNWLATGDLNGDGKPDLVTANIPSSNVSVLLGNGDGTFAAATPYSATVDPFTLTLADLNGDSKLDVVTADTAVNSVGVLLGNGDGTLAAATQFPAGDFPTTVAVGDFNGDSKPDLATANANTGTVSVLLGNGDGTFAAAAAYGTGPVPYDVAVGDLNGDGKPDLAAPSAIGNTVSILLGNGDGTFGSLSSFGTGLVPFSAGIGDFNGDGAQDVGAANNNSNNVSVLLNTTDTTDPEVTINQAPTQADPTTAAKAKFAVHFSEVTAPGTFTDADVTLGGTAGATTATVTADPAGTADQDFIVKVTGLTGPGTVTATVAAGAATDLAGNPNTASTSTDNTVKYQPTFVPGPTASITGEPRVGKTLTAHAGSPSPTPTSKTYKWFADGVPIAGATAKTLAVTQALLGKRIQVKVTVDRPGYLAASDRSDPTYPVSNLPAATISMELNDYSVARGQSVKADIERLAPNEPWKIRLDGVTLARGTADARGIARTTFTIPTNAIVGARTLIAYGLFKDRSDPDRITVR